VVGGHARERTSLIVTVLNEVDTIDDLLASVAAQTQPPDEIVLVDAGSTDGTWERLGDWSARLPLRRLRSSGASISQGRNEAIRAASFDRICVTDAGVRLVPYWLATLSAAFDQPSDMAVDVVSGFFRADPRSTFERAMGATVLPALRDVRPETFLPSSRSVAFTRAAWEAVGGYPEWLDYGEDLVFDLRLKQAGFRFAFAPDAIALFRPRSSLRAFYRQYYLYARGDGKADLWPRRHLIRYTTYALATALCALAAGGRYRRLIAGCIALGVIGYTRRPYARLWPNLGGLTLRQRFAALALVPLLRLVGDVAKMLGYPVGVAWRLKH
jgi:glycosyltransferase involved in cell wall biosynthesis